MDEEISKLMPTSRLMVPIWLGGLSFALGDDETLAQFRADTGNNWTPGRTPIDRMIDSAMGADRAFIISFIRWFNREIWGEVEGRACNGDEL